MSNISGFFQKAVGAISSLWSKENSTDDADSKTDNMYHDGNIGIGDFSSDAVTGQLHIKGDGENMIVLDGNLTEASPAIHFNNPDNAGNCAEFILTNRDGSQWVFEDATGKDLLRMDCNGDLNQDSGGDFILMDGAGEETLRINHENSVTGSPDIYIAAQGLISAESNLFMKSETGYFSWVVGGAGSGTTGTTERMRLDQSGNLQHDGLFYQGVAIGTTVPTSFCAEGGTAANYFNNRAYFEESVLIEEDFWVEFTSSAGGESIWGVNQNDGSGNWHMYWNTVGTTTPRRCANGIAFEWEVNDFGANDALVLKSAENGAAGTAITWQPAIYVRPQTTATGAVGIKRSPTTYDFEVSGRAAKTTTGNWIFLSDRRLKDNIQDFNLSLDTVDQLQPRTFTLKDDQSGEVQVGWIAQEVQSTDIGDLSVKTWISEEVKELPPNANGRAEPPEVKTTEFLALDDAALVPLLVNCVKELNQRIQDLEAQLNPRPSSGGRRTRGERQQF